MTRKDEEEHEQGEGGAVEDVLHLSNDTYLSRIRASKTSAATRASYEMQLKRVLREVSKGKGRVVDLAWVVRHPRRSFEILERGVANRAALRTLVASVLALLKHAGIKKQERSVFSKWYTLYLPLKREVQAEAEEEEATGRLLRGAVKWPDVIAARAELARTSYASREHLLVSMYTYLPPRRQGDYWKLRVISERPYPKRYLELPAYLDMTVEPPQLVVSQYKTANKYDAWSKPLTDPEFVAIMRASLEREPRTHLFVQANGEAFKSANSYTQFSNRVLKRALGLPHVTVNSLRHAATKMSIGDGNKSYAAKKQYAADMGHSYEMHNIYNKVVPQYPEAVPQPPVTASSGSGKVRRKKAAAGDAS